MLLLHLPDPARAARRFVELTAPEGQIVVHDADFTPSAIVDATTSEAAGFGVMLDVMRAASIDVALGPKVAGLLEAAGATVEQVDTQPCDSVEDGLVAGEISRSRSSGSATALGLGRGDRGRPRGSQRSRATADRTHSMGRPCTRGRLGAPHCEGSLVRPSRAHSFIRHRCEARHLFRRPRPVG